MADNFPNTETIATRQAELTARWHREPSTVNAREGFDRLVEENHLRNYTLWHHEDDARRDDKGFEFVYRAKRAIDRNNQERNDFIEQIDRHLFEQYGGNFTQNTPMNSETPGSIIDRLSIMALKEYHMREEVERPDATGEHIRACSAKLGVIAQQIQDLKQALELLIKQCESGERGFRVYYQFKMYNDPSLNPALYKSGS